MKRAVVVLCDMSRFLDRLVVKRDGMSSCETTTVRVGEVIICGMDWVQDAESKKAEPLSASFDSTSVAGGGVALPVSHMGWYRLKEKVARRR